MDKKHKNISFGATLSFILFTFLPLLSSSILGYFLVKYQLEVSQFSFFQWFLLSIVLIFTSALALSPPTLLAVIFGYFLGYMATPLILLINIGAILLIYGVYKIFNFDSIQEFLNSNSKAKKILINIKKEELKIIFFTKLSPVLPFALTNLVFAVSGARLRNILLGGFLGMIPRSVLAIFTGYQAKEINTLMSQNGEGIYSKIILIALFGVSIWGIVFTIKKAGKKS